MGLGCSLGTIVGDCVDGPAGNWQELHERGRAGVSCAHQLLLLLQRHDLISRENLENTECNNQKQRPMCHLRSLENELKHLSVCISKPDNVCFDPFNHQRIISPGFDLFFFSANAFVYFYIFGWQYECMLFYTSPTWHWQRSFVSTPRLLSGCA